MKHGETGNFKIFYFLKNRLGLNLLLLKIIYFFYTVWFIVNIFYFKEKYKKFTSIFNFDFSFSSCRKTYNEYFDPLMFVLFSFILVLKNT